MSCRHLAGRPLGRRLMTVALTSLGLWSDLHKIPARFWWRVFFLYNMYFSGIFACCWPSRQTSVLGGLGHWLSQSSAAVVCSISFSPFLSMHFPRSELLGSSAIIFATWPILMYWRFQSPGILPRWSPGLLELVDLDCYPIQFPLLRLVCTLGLSVDYLVMRVQVAFLAVFVGFVESLLPRVGPPSIVHFVSPMIRNLQVGFVANFRCFG